MPHLIVEYSANVAERVDIGVLVDTLHATALETGIAPVDALRTRGARCDDFAVGDRHPDNAFVAVTARLGPGRTDEQLGAFVETLMNALDGALGDARDTMMLSVECQEIDPDRRVNRNHLRSVIDARTDP